MGTDVRTATKQKNRWRWINPALRIGAAVQVVLVVVQASLAGLSLTGSSEALVWHRRLGEGGRRAPRGMARRLGRRQRQPESGLRPA